MKNNYMRLIMEHLKSIILKHLFIILGKNDELN